MDHPTKPCTRETRYRAKSDDDSKELDPVPAQLFLGRNDIYKEGFQAFGSESLRAFVSERLSLDELEEMTPP